jgi:glycosyltransferase involved in cell wall biosynthesis
MSNFGIDITSIPVKPAGVGHYILQLTKAISDVLKNTNDSFFVFGQTEQKERSEFKDSKFIDCGKMSIYKRTFWEQSILPYYLKKYQIHLLHSPNHTIPFFTKCKRVCTIHDLSWHLFPERKKYLYALYYKSMINYSIRHADLVFTDSDNTKNDILRIVKPSKNNIHTLYPGANNFFTKLDNQKVLFCLNKFRIKNPYFFFVGTIEPNKNIERLIYAFNGFLESSNQIFSLVLAGKKGWSCKEVNKLIEESENKIQYINYVTNEDLIALYNGAHAFIYPSLYEGFGMPPLEAMACGAPVLCSNTSSLPEVVGDAAISFNPYNVDEIKEAMVKSLVIGKRQSLIEKGFIQLNKFSWKKTSSEIYRFYKAICN